jgi:hypothetical protein
MYIGEHSDFVLSLDSAVSIELIRKCYMQIAFIEQQLKPVRSDL